MEPAAFPAGSCNAGRVSRLQSRRSGWARRIPVLASIPGWRHSECALEGSVERRFRLVAHGCRDIRNPLRGRRQRLGSQTQSPSGQVRHRRIRQVTRETRHQRRAGYADFSGELGDGPWVMRAPVKQREALAHDRVSCAGEPPRRLIRETCHVSPQGIHEQRFRQLCQHRVAARTVRGGLLYQMLDRLLQPVAGAIGPDVHLQHRWQAL